MNRNTKTFGIVMFIGAVVIAVTLYNFPIAIWGGNGLLKWEVVATLFLMAGSFITLWGMTELRKKNRIMAFQFFMVTLSISMMVGLFYKFWTFIPQRDVLVFLDLNSLVGMFSLPLSRYLDRRDVTQRGTPQIP